jgi:hypothetical protein
MMLGSKIPAGLVRAQLVRIFIPASKGVGYSMPPRTAPRPWSLLVAIRPLSIARIQSIVIGRTA